MDKKGFILPSHNIMPSDKAYMFGHTHNIAAANIYSIEVNSNNTKSSLRVSFPTWNPSKELFNRYFILKVKYELQRLCQF